MYTLVVREPGMIYFGILTLLDVVIFKEGSTLVSSNAYSPDMDRNALEI